MSSPTSGGFIRPELLSPPATSTTSSIASPLPQPRSHPLKFGSSKESTFIRYVDEAVNRIQRKFAKRAAIKESGVPESSEGYDSFKQVAADLEKLMDVIWVSGTPSLQIPYLLTLALLTVDTMTRLPPSPKAMFRLLDKLDVAFASLMQGHDWQTGEALPGFASGRKVNGTEKVRIKSLIERTRICVVDVMSSNEAGFTDDIEEEEDNRTEQSMDDSATYGPDDMNIDEDEGWEMDIAKVYDRTIVELGNTIGGTPIGIVTDD